MFIKQIGFTTTATLNCGGIVPVAVGVGPGCVDVAVGVSPDGVTVGNKVAVDRGVPVIVGSKVAVQDGVFVGGGGVNVSGAGVSVAGTGVPVRGTEVLVGGTGVAVFGSGNGVWVGTVSLGVGEPAAGCVGTCVSDGAVGVTGDKAEAESIFEFKDGINNDKKAITITIGISR